MTSLPQLPAASQEEIDVRLHNLERQLRRIKQEKHAAKRERRRPRRVRRGVLFRKIRRIGRTTLYVLLLAAGAAAFIASMVLLVMGAPGYLDRFETAAAAWGLAALVRPRRSSR